MSKTKDRIIRLILFAGVSLTLAAANAQAATLTVTKIADTDDGVCNADCSLREAIAVAASGDTIVFSLLFNTSQTIGLSPVAPYNGGLIISTALTINGPGSDLLTISSGGGDGLLISNSGALTVSGMTITGSGSTGIENLGSLVMDACVITGNDGGGIVNASFLNVNNSTVSENTGDLAGGIVNTGTATITNSTISNNAAADTNSGGGGIYTSFILDVINSTISANAKLGGNNNGGGIYHVLIDVPAVTTISSSTITNNSADGSSSASGVFKEGFFGGFFGDMTIGNTIIAANVNNSIKPDVVETSVGIFSTGFNLVGNCAPGLFMFLGDSQGTAAAPLDPLLDPLDDYDGMTATHRLQVNSPAIDQGNTFLTEDQRSFTRPYDKVNQPNAPGGDGSDIGAYEVQFAVGITGAVYNYLGMPVRNARVLITAANGDRRAVKTDITGVYRFRSVARNRNYQVSVSHREFEFVPQIVMVREENINNLKFTAVP